MNLEGSAGTSNDADNLAVRCMPIVAVIRILALASPLKMLTRISIRHWLAIQMC